MRPHFAINSLYDRLLQNIFAQAYGASGDEEAMPNPFMQMFGMQGNMGDYVVGERGLDDIISRLMEQTAG